LEGNPYRAIVARNAFRLKDPVPLPEPEPPAPPPPEVPKIDVKVAGLAKIGGVRYAYLMVPDPDRQGQFEYPALTDNPRQGGGVRHRSGIEVREIDLKAQTVRLVNGGIETTLSLKEDGVKSAPAVAARPGHPVAGAVAATGSGAHLNPLNIRRPGVTANPAVNTAVPNAADGAEGLVFSRERSRSGRGAGPANTMGVPTANAGMSTPHSVMSSTPAPSVSFPTRPLRTDPSSSAAAPTPSIPIEQQYQVLIEQRRIADSVGVPLPPIPGLPTPAPVDPAP
jgi:hypothetical protein